MKPGVRLSQRNLLKLVQFIEGGRHSFSRSHSLNEIGAHGYGKMPLPERELSEYIEYAIESGLIEEENNRGIVNVSEDQDGLILLGFVLTAKGHDFLEDCRRTGFWRSNFRSLKSNFVTIVVSVSVAVLTSWALFFWGAPK